MRGGGSRRMRSRRWWGEVVVGSGDVVGMTRLLHIKVKLLKD